MAPATLSCLVVDVRDPPNGFGADTYIQMGGGVGAELDSDGLRTM